MLCVKIQDIATTIYSAFHIVGMQDLSLTARAHHHIYEFLQSIYRSAYDPNHKIIFFSNQEPDYELLKHVQQALRHFDISNWFVTLLCPGDLAKSLESLRTQHSTDDHAIGHISCLVVDASTLPGGKMFEIPPTMCPLAWEGLKIHANGEMVPCCIFKGNIKDANGTKININTHQIKDFCESKDLVSLRNDLVAGKKPTSCQVCWTSESNGGKSTRLLALENFGTKFRAKSLDHVGIDRLKSIDLALGNLCNLKCNICNWTRSSQIAAESVIYEKRNDHIKKWNSDSRWINDPSALAKFQDIFTNIEFLEFEGGDPFYHNYHLDFLKEVSAADQCKNIRLRYSTNGTIFLDERTLWDRFREVHICFSIDDVGPRFEYQRTLAKWNEVSDNLGLYRNIQNEKLIMSFFITVNIQNVYYLPEILETLDRYDWPYNLSLLQWPIQLSIFSLTESAKIATIEKLEKFVQKDRRKQALLFPLIDAVKNIIPTNGQHFQKFMMQLDDRRHRNYADAHPEMSALMCYNR